MVQPPLATSGNCRTRSRRADRPGTDQASTRALHERDRPTGNATVDVPGNDYSIGAEIMSTKITVIYDNPVDRDAFEAGYPNQLALARKIPGIQRMETSKVWPKEDGSPTPAYRLLDMYFTDYDSASAAVTTEEAGAFFPSVFESATGGVRIVFADVDAS
jgi:uncharacterized protein (TIGR02118 family)